VLCVVRYRFLRRADHLSREVLSSVVCLSVIAEPQQCGQTTEVVPFKKSEHCWNDNDRGNSNFSEINLCQGNSGHLKTYVDWDAIETGSS